jgi:hypothetical protein
MGQSDRVPMEMAALRQDFSSIRGTGANNTIIPIGVGIPEDSVDGDRTIDHCTPNRGRSGTMDKLNPFSIQDDL